MVPEATGISVRVVRGPKNGTLNEIGGLTGCGLEENYSHLRSYAVERLSRYAHTYLSAREFLPASVCPAFILVR